MFVSCIKCNCGFDSKNGFSEPYPWSGWACPPCHTKIVNTKVKWLADGTMDLSGHDENE